MEERRLGWVVRSRLTRNRAWVEVQVEVQVEAYEVEVKVQMEEVEHLLREHPGVPPEVDCDSLHHSGLPMASTELGL